ncbi:glycoside hydrolase family 16 protein [Pluteus cervinus]|uniref:Glycoside hydrolase family 16 protein n=1 Tax=Pluteus cervinus TaxID=181527 RepID=A0ACD3ABK5_9AGAR|nr:glycoside hydrolase family 16 protein [Pluteus cervinus]
MNAPEPDDVLHNPDPTRDRVNDRGGSFFSSRGMMNLGCLALLVLGLMALFAGYPLASYFTETKQTTKGGFNLGGINASGQIPEMAGGWGLIDAVTPTEALKIPSYTNDGEEYVLVFSDEFEQEGRTFYPGDDPYWEAVDLHYWGTGDLEWYDPSAVTTKDGSLQITLSKVNPDDNHNLSYKSAMLQSWNKFCFTGGMLQTSVRLPGSNSVHGLWPAIWSMGNLGRAGFGASLEGMWPYSYDNCDVGTLPNQTYPGTSLPIWAHQGGDGFNGGELSFLPGQKLSACTCPGESHPGPVRSDGTYVGRSAPEIDVLEAIIGPDGGQVSLSAQFAPFNAEYHWINTSDTYMIVDPVTTQLNEYVGGVFQQTTSGLALSNQLCYELNGGCFATYGFEYLPGFDNAYITWINDNKRSWTVYQGALAKDPRVEIGERPISQEPMYIIANLGFSMNFGGINFEDLTLPATMSIDWVRVYQKADSINVGCDPINFPTAAYINTYPEAYTNANLTLWADYNQTFPRNKLMQPGGVC